MGECALRGRSRTSWVPEWLEKWAALIMEYVETEQALLPQELLALRPPYATYTPASAAAEAKGMPDCCIVAPGLPDDTANYAFDSENAAESSVLHNAALAHKGLPKGM